MKIVKIAFIIIINFQKLFSINQSQRKLRDFVKHNKKHNEE